MVTLSREEFDRFRVQHFLDEGTAQDEADGQRLVDGEYPKSTRQAILELRLRGLDATPWRIECCCRHKELAPPTVGGSRCWAKGHIDRLADVLEDEGHLTIAALVRQERDVSGGRDPRAMTWAEWVRKETARFNRKARRNARGGY